MPDILKWMVKHRSKWITRYVPGLWVVCCLMLATISPAWSQSPVIARYSTAEGVSSNTIYSLAQDPDGFLWIATDNGIVRYDGSKFITFSTETGLPENEILKLFRDSKGRIWYSSLSGHFGYIRDGHIYTADELSYPRKKFSSYIHGISEDLQGGLWFATRQDGIWVLRGDVFYQVSDEVSHHTLMLRNGNSMRVISIVSALNETHLSVYNTKLLSREYSTTVERKEIVEKNLPFTSPLMVDSTTISGMYFAEPYRLTFPEMQGYKLLPREIEAISQVAFFRDGEDCFQSFAKKGILQYRIRRDYSVEPPCTWYLDGISVSSIIKDFQGNLWCGSLGDGLYKIAWNDRKNISRISVPEGREINTIEALNDSVALVTDQKGSVYTLKDGRLEQVISFITRDKGVTNIFPSRKGLVLGFSNSWMAIMDDDFLNGAALKVDVDSLTNTYVKSHSFSEKYKAVFSEPIPVYIPDGLLLASYVIKSIAASSDTSFVMGTNLGITILNASGKNIRDLKFSSYETAEKRRVFCGDMDRKKVYWYATGDGLYSMDTAEVITERVLDDVLRNKINCIKALPSGGILIATDGNGLFLYSHGALRSIYTEDGRAGRRILDLFLEKDVRVWASTSRGIYFADLLPGKEDSLVFRLHPLSSFVDLTGNKNMIVMGSSLVFSNDGYINYIPASVNTSRTREFPMYIESIKMGDSAFVFTGSGEPIQTHETRIGFSFIGIDYKSAGNILYEYRLSGVASDTLWHTTQYPEITYAYLSPGEYDLEVRAIAADGLRSVNTAVCSFTILPPWYSTWTFRILAFTFLILLVGVVFYTRVRIARRRNEMELRLLESEQKALRSQMNPHFIFNSLNSIQRFLVNNNANESIRYLTKFGRLIRSILDHSRESAIPVGEELNSLRLYMELESLRTGHKFDSEIILDETLDELSDKLPPLLLQPYVENAIWHGIMAKEGRGKIVISLTDIGDFIRCRIEDDGIGRAKARELKGQAPTHRKSHGMNITAERIALLNRDKRRAITVKISDLQNTDGSPGGTRVEMDIPKNF